MSGYRALRLSDSEDPRISVREPRGSRAVEVDAPAVLARVADFLAEPRRADDDSPEDPHSERHDPRAASGDLSKSIAALALRSRLGVVGLVLAAAVFGFVLGRITSPDPAKDAQAWSPQTPAPSAPEAPTWKSQSGTVAQEGGPGEPGPSGVDPTSSDHQAAAPADASAAAPWEFLAGDLSRAAAQPPATAQPPEPAWNQTPPASQTDRQSPPAGQQPSNVQSPWSPPAGKPADAEDGPQWTVHRGAMAPAARPASQPESGHRPPHDPYSTTWMARRSTTPVQPNTQPVASISGRHSTAGQSTPISPPMDQGRPSAAVSHVPGQATAYPTTHYPTTGANYPTTGYPAEYPTSGKTIVR